MKTAAFHHRPAVALGILLAGLALGCNRMAPPTAPTAAPPVVLHPPATAPPEILPGACDRPPLLALDRHGLTVAYAPSGDQGPLRFSPGQPCNVFPSRHVPVVLRYRPDHSLAWVRSAPLNGNTNTDAGWYLTGIATDSAGSTYLAGELIGRAAFADTVFRARPCTSPGLAWHAARDPLLVKLDARGRRQWVRQLGTGDDGSIGGELLSAVATDEAGNCYATGVLAPGGAVPGAAGQAPYALAAGGSFVASWDAAGRRRWVRPLQPTERGGRLGCALALTPGARELLVLVGADIAPDSLPPEAAVPGDIAPRLGYQLSRLNAATGAERWQRHIYAAASAPWRPSVPDGSGPYFWLTGLAADAAGGAVIIGSSDGVTVAWDAMTPAWPLPDSARLFVGRYDSLGRGQWVRGLHAERYHKTRSGSAGHLLGVAARDSLVWLTGVYYGRPPDALVAYGWRVGAHQAAHGAFLAAYSLGGELREAYPWPAAPAPADSVYRLDIGPPCVPVGGGPGWLPASYRPARPEYPPDGSGPKPAPRALLGRWP